MPRFRIETEHHPRGDRPRATADLVAGIRRGRRFQTMPGGRAFRFPRALLDADLLSDRRELDGIPRSGEERKRALPRHLRSLERIRETRETGLAAADGIGPALAARVYAALSRGDAG